MPLGQASARKTDPSTSHEAAANVEASGKAATQRERCHKAVLRSPGCTAGEVDYIIGEQHVACRRLPELRQRGLIHNGPTRKCTQKKTNMMTWWPTEIPDEQIQAREGYEAR